MKLSTLFDIVNREVNGEEILAFAKDFRKYPLKLSYSSFNEGMEFLTDFYSKAGLEAQTLHFPADGHTVYGDRHFPYAWDVYEAWAEVDGERIADYAQDTYSVIPFSADSGGVREKILLPLEELENREDLTDYAALITRYPSSADVRALIAKGCQVFFATVDTEPIDPSLDDSRRWYNDLFGAGQMDYRDKSCVGFSITPRIGRTLLAKLAAGVVKVTYRMHTATYAGQVCASTAVIPGEDDRCFLITAHGYEPHATNDVAGIAMSMGAAKALSSLIASGKLPKPKHSIRFFHGLENFGLYAWGMENPDIMGNAIGGTSVDSFGRYGAGGKREHFVLRRCLNVHPSDQHALAREVLEMVCRSRGIGFETREASKNNEDLMQDGQFGPAWNLLYGSLWEEPRQTYPRCYFYHTSVDTADALSPQMLSAAAVYAAVLAYFTACGEGEELKQLAFADWKRYTDEKCREALRLEDASEALRRIRGQRLQAWGELAVSSAAKALERTDLIKEMTAYIQNRVASAVGILCGSAPGLTADKGKTVIRRTIGGPIGLGTLSEELRQRAAEVLGYYSNEYWCLEECGANLYYFDGKRSVFEVAKAVWATRAYGPHEDPEGFEKEYALYSGIAQLLLDAGEAEIVERPTVSKEDIKGALRKLGIGAGDRVMVHSSLKALGKIDGGPETMIKALQETVTESGIVAMPAFTDCVDGGVNSRPPFNRELTPPETWIGAIPEAFRKSPGVIRSPHPTHSVCAWGGEAEAFLAQNEPYDCFADDGPWGKLAERGKIVFIGPAVYSNTFLHACEKWFAGYLDETMAMVDTGEGIRQVRVTNYPGGCRGRWYKLGEAAPYLQKLQKMGAYTRVELGESCITMCDGPKLKEAARQMFAEDRYILLHECGCRDCARMRAKKP